MISIDFDDRLKSMKHYDSGMIKKVLYSVKAHHANISRYPYAIEILTFA